MYNAEHLSKFILVFASHLALNKEIGSIFLHILN